MLLRVEVATGLYNRSNLSRQCFSGIARYRAIPPPKMALKQPRGEGGSGYCNSSCPLEGIELYEGIAEIVSPTECATE